MKVFLIILNFNGKKFISNCLNSVSKLKVENFELKIIAVDNASTDGSEKIIENLKTKIKNLIFIQNKENLGFAEGNNVGIRHALENGADYIMILNPDTVVDKNLLIQLIKVAEPDKKIGILGPKIYFAYGFEYHKERYKGNERGRVIFYAGGEIDWDNVLSKHRGVDEVDKGQYGKIEETDFVSGCAMMVKKEVFEKIGFFDKNYFLYWEDSDFCQRAKKAGYKIVYVPLGLVWHLDAGSSKVGGPLHDYYLTRNRLLFGMKYASFRAKFALLRESIKILFFGRKWQKIGIRDFYLGKFIKGSYM